MESLLSCQSAVIIVAAGNSSRFGVEDKITYHIAGKPLFLWSLSTFASHPLVSKIVLVISAGMENFFLPFIQQFTKPIFLVEGGSSRHLSVRSGFSIYENDKPDLILVHDAARPLIHASTITRSIIYGMKYPIVAIGHPVLNALHRLENQHLIETVDKTNLWSVETPQIFQYSVLAHCLNMTQSDHFFDEVSLAKIAKYHVFCIQNFLPNPKVTWKQDIFLIEKLLQS